MKEKEFYDILEKTEEMGNVTAGYFPKVKTLERYDVKKHIPEFVILLSYFASDPFARNCPEKKDDPEYKATVKYAKSLLYGIELED